MAERGAAAERTRLAHLNQLAHEVSRIVRHTLECVGRLLSSPTDTAEPSGLLVSSLRRLSDCLERVFDSFADTSAQHDRHLNCAERQQQRALSEGLLRRMKELILQGAGIIQAAQQQHPVAEAEALERGFKGVVQRFVVDLREIIRLQHVIVEPADDQQHGGPFADGNHSGPSALPSRTTTDVAADVCSVTSSVSHGASPTGRPPVPSHQPGCALAEKNVWLRAGTPTDGETGEPRKTDLTHALAARRLMNLGRRASHEAGLGGGSTSTSTTADAAGDGGDEGDGSPVTVHPYRRSRIVYGFKVKEGAMKLKVELQTEEAEEGESEMEGRPWGEGGGDEVPQPREADRWSGGGGGPEEELSDEQFVSMMLNFFGEMERRKAALVNTPPAARRNPHPPPDATTTPPAAAQVPGGGGGPPAAELHASTPSDEREPNEEGKARKIPHSPPTARQQHERDGEEGSGSGTSPTRQQQLKKKKAVAENEGGGSRQGAKAKEGRWYKCILS